MSRLIAVFLAGAILTACGSEEPATDSAPTPDAGAAVETACPQPDENGVVNIQDGLIATIVKPGYGRVAQGKDYADVHTTLWLYDESAEGGRGTVIWTSGGERPFQFQLDAGQVITGWDLGVNCMLVGVTRELKIAPELAYGEQGKHPVPPNATLLFKIELANLTSP